MEPGMVLRNPDLATVLSDIGRGGISGFYRGGLAAAIVGAISRRDGFVTARDLAAHRSHWVEPIGSGYRDLTVYELPPPTQGLAALAMIARLRELNREELQPGPAFVARFKRIRDACYPLRDRYITDPEFAAAPVEPFLDPTYAAARGGAGLADDAHPDPRDGVPRRPAVGELRKHGRRRPASAAITGADQPRRLQPGTCRSRCATADPRAGGRRSHLYRGRLSGCGRARPCEPRLRVDAVEASLFRPCPRDRDRRARRLARGCRPAFGPLGGIRPLNGGFGVGRILLRR